jgi:asparaginyl-tRNA synthetase
MNVRKEDNMEAESKLNLTDIKALYRNREAFIGREVTVGGWVRSNRDSKNFGFLVINDGTF